MPPWLRAAALCAACLLVAAHARAQSLPISAPGSQFFAPPPALMTEIEDEGVVMLDAAPPNGDRVGRAEALVLFEQPRATVMRMLASTARQIEYRPELQTLHIVKASEDRDLAEYRLRVMLTTLRYRTLQHWDFEHGRIWWSLDESFPNEVRTLDGLWELRALDERRTLGHFTTRIDLGAAVPAFLQEMATRQKLPEAMRHIRRWVDSNGRWRP